MLYTYMPVSTVTVQSTVTKTTFVTVRRSDEAARQSSTAPVLSTTASSVSAPSPIVNTPVEPDSTNEKPTTSFPLPIVTTQSSTTIPTTTVSITTELAPITTTAVPEWQDITESRRHAIIGGLSGSIAGLLLIGGLFFFFMRRRRRQWNDLDSMSEKGDPNTTAKRWTTIMHRHAKTAPPAPLSFDRRSTAGSVEQDQLIRINTNSWSRPYVRGQGEGIRDSYPSTVLRVMNPDATQDGNSTRTPTPVRRNDTLDSGTTSPGTFLRKQRSALVAALYANSSRNGSAVDVSGTQNRPRPLPPIPPPPAMTIQRVPSHASTIRAASMRSTLSNSTLPIVSQHPLEDPFRADSIRSRSSIGQPQGAVYRTLDRVNNMLDSLRARQNNVHRGRPPSQRSVSTLGSSGYSDPFDLDNRSPLTPHYRSCDVR